MGNGFVGSRGPTNGYRRERTAGRRLGARGSDPLASSPGNPNDVDPKGRAQFLSEVFPAERRYIELRRRALDPTAKLPRDASAPPSAADGLVGLALSGGGIRSATFNLGVLQALHRRGILPRVDYLSTVSGGGWIGAAFQALLASDRGGVDGAGPAPFPFATSDELAGASPALGYLRARADSLVPLGLGGGARALALLVRGQLLTWSLLLPVVIFLVCASSPLVTVYLDWSFAQHGVERPPYPGWLPPWTWFTEGSRQLLGLAVAWNALTMVLLSLARLSPSWRRRLERSGSIALVGALAALALEIQIYVIVRWYHGVMYPAAGHEPNWGRAFQLAAAAGAAAWLVARFVPYGQKLVRPLMMATAFGVSLAIPYATFLSAVSAFLRRYPTADSAGWMSNVLGPSWWPTAALVAFVFANILHANHVSLHGFYRGRLSRMFLLRALPPAGGGDGRPGVSSAEAVRLSEINRDGSWAPYALLNAALNLQGVDDASLHGRQCDFFVFSRCFMGSDRVGYCATRDMEQLVTDLDLGTAMAVSGAAAAPNMGTYTQGAAVSLMTFLNIRLGYWLPHPGRVSVRSTSAGWLARLRWYPAGLSCYLRELLSRIDDHGDLVFLTDGGHLENTGAYELLRRRCAVVIASDAEEDPALAFGGLAALVRYARISLGTEIELDVGALRRDAKGFSATHAVVGTIRYPAIDGVPAETGTLVYVKATVTGDEDVLIEEYRSRNDDFPHQSTADQVFDETQFEAYRSLGFHAVGDSPEAGLDGWLAELEGRAAVVADEVHARPAATDDHLA